MSNNMCSFSYSLTNLKKIMEIQRIAAFSYQNSGGNPAGVMICDDMPIDIEMLNIAKSVGYSETAFLKFKKDGWQIRYFSPEIEVPFCGHATIASGAALGAYSGVGTYKLYLNEGEISVDVSRSEGGAFSVTLQSPETWSKVAGQDYSVKVLNEFNLSLDDLDMNFPVRFAFAGAKHLILVLKDRATLANMSYNFGRLKVLMKEKDLVTINLLWCESSNRFHSRNPFPPGGVHEDPATGAAAAAFAGYLRDIGWNGENRFVVLQGEDMGAPSRLLVEYSAIQGEGIKVTGETRYVSDAVR